MRTDSQNRTYFKNIRLPDIRFVYHNRVEKWYGAYSHNKPSHYCNNPFKGDRKVHVKGGTVVNADHMFEADVYCETGIIQ